MSFVHVTVWASATTGLPVVLGQHSATTFKVKHVSKNLNVICYALMWALLDMNIAFWKSTQNDVMYVQAHAKLWNVVFCTLH